MLPASLFSSEPAQALVVEQMCRLLDFVPVPVLLTDEIERDGAKQRIHRYANRCFLETIGYTVDDIPNVDAWYLAAYPDKSYRHEIITASERAIDESLYQKHQSVRTISRVRCKDGSDHWFEIIHEPHNALSDRWHIVAFLEVTEFKIAHAELDILSQTDALTQLLNRRGLLRHLEREVTRTQRTKKAFSVVVCDLDHFKRVNDTYGHECGDVVLREVATLLRTTLRDHDIVARWGGEEFCLILPETEIDGALGLIERVRTALASKTICYRSVAITPTLTFGISRYTPRATVADLIRWADMAMYYGKAHGRDRATVYSPAVEQLRVG